MAKASPDFEVGKTTKNHILWGKAAIEARCGRYGQPCEAAEGEHSPPARPSSWKGWGKRRG